MKTRNEIVTEFLQGLDTEIDIINIVDVDNVTDFQSLYEAIQDNNGFEMEVIYYSNAIEYLMENDPSLKQSLALADEMGYNVLSLSSEILASLLKSKNVMDEFCELEDEINEFFEGLEDEVSEFENYSTNAYDEADNHLFFTFGMGSKQYGKFQELGRTDEAIEYAIELGFDIPDED